MYCRYIMGYLFINLMVDILQNKCIMTGTVDLTKQNYKLIQIGKYFLLNSLALFKNVFSNMMDINVIKSKF